MKRLLKIKEFFHLQKKREHVGGEDRSRPAKRPRRASLKKDNEPEPKLQSAASLGTPKSSSRRQKFLDLFEDEVAKDILWWLPGRRGEAFALNRERFERELIKKQFQGQSFVNFLANLSRWGFRQMNIPSLSGRVLAFELSSQNVAGWRSGRRTSGHDKSKKRARNAENSSSSNIHIERTTTPLVSNLRHDGDGQRQTATSTAANPSLFGSIHLQQAQYLAQQEMAQTYVSLLWQELQRQLTVLFLQQGHPSLQATQPQAQTHSRHRHHHHHNNRHNNNTDEQTQQPASSAIADVAALLHQQQLQQQIAAANLYQVLTEPRRPANQQTLLQELAEIHQQQLSNLTYQIVALVAANMDTENQSQQPQVPQPPLIQKILVKYLIALVLLQLQQQQQNLEVLRQERQSALAVVQSPDNATTGLTASTATANSSTTTTTGNASTGGDTRRAAAQQEDGRQLHNVSVIQMQQLLSDTAMLSLSRVHQLLLEAAVLIQPISVAPPVAAEQPNPPAQHHITTPATPTFPGTRLSLNPNGTSSQAPRATTAR